MNNTEIHFYWFAIAIVLILMTYLLMLIRSRKKIENFKTLEEAINKSSSELSKLEEQVAATRQEYEAIDQKTKSLQGLLLRSEELHRLVKEYTESVDYLRAEIDHNKVQSAAGLKKLKAIMAKIDLYSRLEEYTDCGHFETPDFLFQTSSRFAEEIKNIRKEQKEMITGKMAVTYPENVKIHENKSENKRILDGQVNLILKAFNIECDLLISKVKPSNFSSTLERINSVANTLEKTAASLHCGLSLDYTQLKLEECRLQYQYTLKKQEEQEEQRQIQEQIKEEQRAIKEYEREVAAAEKEERLYSNLLERARKELEEASDEERIIAKLKIAELEAQLEEAETREKRAKSMAEQTRRGHIYVISNVGSFGEGIYKIGLTRRLDPMDRVKELGDASVPFSFDVHAIIYAENAPSLETALHHKFSAKRINAVNLRKEFFQVDLTEIKNTVDEITGHDADFKMTALAEEYFETRRLRKRVEGNAEKDFFSQFDDEEINNNNRTQTSPKNKPATETHN